MSSHIFLSIYKPHNRFSNGVDKDRCRASVSSTGRGCFTYQCQRAGKHKGKHEGKTYLFCKQHHPDTLAEKKKDWEGKFIKGEAARDLRYAIESLEGQIVEQVLRAAKIESLPTHIKKKAKQLEKLRAKREEAK